MDALQRLTAGHEDLASGQLAQYLALAVRGRLTLSNAVEHALGWVATKMGLLDMFSHRKQNAFRDSIVSQQRLSGMLCDYIKFPQSKR